MVPPALDKASNSLPGEQVGQAGAERWEGVFWPLLPGRMIAWLGLSPGHSILPSSLHLGL